MLKHFKTDGWYAEADDCLPIGKVVYGKPLKRSAIFSKSPKGGKSVLRTGLNENVHILGHARLGMDKNGVAANHDVLNAVRVEGGPQLF